MAEVAYTRKYRPKVLSDYLGESVKQKVLSRFHDEKNFPQTILLYGTRGTGKTTLARLIAKEYLCIDRQNGCACGKCDMCVTLDETLIEAEFGTNTSGVTEVNVGTDGGKEDIERIIDEMQQPPQFMFNYNIFILDECHMLTRQAQNSLLKVMEEPPKHLVIILATTEPEKLLGTIRDRCQLRIQMKPLTVDDLVNRMMFVSQCEKLEVSINALKFIAKACKKNPRDCLMTLENIAKNYDYKVNMENAMAELGSLHTTIYEKYMLAATSAEPIAGVLTHIQLLEESGVTYRDFLEGFAEFVLNCIQLRYGIGAEDNTDAELLAASKLFKEYSLGELDCLLQIVEYAVAQVSTNEKLGKLSVLNTALRIGKVGMLSQGLQQSTIQANIENEIGTQKAIQDAEEKQKLRGDTGTAIEDPMLMSVFGKQLVEIAPESEKKKAEIEVVAADEDDIADKFKPDEVLMSLLGSMTAPQSK